MSFDAQTNISERWLLSCLNVLFCFLLVTVLLVPYRFLNFPEIPSVFGQLIRHFPFVICIGMGILWCVLRRTETLNWVNRIPLSPVVLGLLGAGLLSSLGSDKVAMSLAKDFYYFVTGGFLFLIIGDLNLEKNKVRRFILLCVSTGYWVALYGIFVIWAGNDIFFGRIFSPENEIYLKMSPDPWFGNRILSSIGHPVFLGTLMVMVLPVSFSFFVLEKRMTLKLIFLIGTLVLFVALILTFSRGAWIAGGIAGISYLILRKVRPVWYLVGIGVVFAGVFVVLLSSLEISNLFVERLYDAYELYVLDFASTSRGKALGHTVEILGTSPLLGVGTGMYRFKAYVLGRDILWPPILDTPDNMYLLWIAEHGVLGLFAVVLFLTYFFRLFIIRLHDGVDELALGLVAGFIGFFVNILSCSALTFPTIRIVFWILAGLAVTYIISSNSEDQYREQF
jgi:putative inorganic carbon (hco3(-)) transporter